MCEHHTVTNSDANLEAMARQIGEQIPDSIVILDYRGGQWSSRIWYSGGLVTSCCYGDTPSEALTAAWHQARQDGREAEAMSE